MNKDVLLIYPPHFKIAFVSSIPHLAAYAKKQGFTVDALDAPTLGWDMHDIVDYIGATEPRSIGISIPFTNMGESGLKLIKQIKKFYPRIPLIVGGVHPTLCPEEFVEYAIVCKGDGETVFGQFLNGVKVGSFGPEGFMNGVMEGPVPIEDIEPPDWNVVSSHKYEIHLPTGEKAFPIQGSRGCVYNCVFCSSKLLFAGGVQYKTMEQINNEIQQGIATFGVKAIIFRDENITLNLDRFLDYCEYLKERNIIWWAQTRANLINKDLAKVAKESGCVGISIGVETGDPYVMKKIQKGVTLKLVEEAFRVLKEANLKTAANFMIGHPWDTPGSVERTLDFAHKIDPNYLGIQIATPFPGTDFRKIVFEQGIKLDTKWGNYHTSKVNYTPPGLKGFDLVQLRDQIYWRWFKRKPSRLLFEFNSRKSLKAKLRFIRNVWRMQK
jgi:radical SAM superfamily enzyme YgiQ (UPF0313 family)